MIDTTGATAGQVLTYNTSTTTWVASAAPGSAGGSITSGTAVTLTNQTSVDFTGIPSTAKKITVMFRNISSNGSSYYQVQLGTSSGVESTGYLGTGGQVSGSVSNVAISTGFSVPVTSETWVSHGMFTIVKLDGNVYVASGQLYASATTAYQWSWGGSKSLSGVLDRVRLTTVNGTDQFDAGTINIMWE